MIIENQLTNAVIVAIKKLYGKDVSTSDIQLQKTRTDFEGNITLVTFPLLKISHKNPEATAIEIGEYLKSNCSAVEKFNVVKGFLNIVISNAAWIELLNTIDSDEKFGEKKSNAKQSFSNGRIFISKYK